MNTITVRCPLRICLCGGGSDLPVHFRKHGGDVVSATIDRYLTVAVEPEYYHPGEIVPHEYAIASGWTERDRIDVTSDVAAGSGLGGSGALMACLLKAKHPELAEYELASAAYNIERYTLCKPIGWQDSTVAAYGGIVSMHIGTDGRMEAKRLPRLPRLESQLLLFKTGIQRNAADVLRQQSSAVACKAESEKAMQEIHRLGIAMMRDIYETGGERYGELTHRHWMAKKATSESVTTPDIDRWYETALKHGATGGKCVGAGAGGFMLFVAPEHRHAGLISAIESEGLKNAGCRCIENRVCLMNTPSNQVAERKSEDERER